MSRILFTYTIRLDLYKYFRRLALCFSMTTLFSGPTNATIIFGPISVKESCPGSGRGQTQANVKYCYFDDPRIIQVLNAPCPSGLRGASNLSTGKQQWCILRK